MLLRSFHFKTKHIHKTTRLLDIYLLWEKNLWLWIIYFRINFIKICWNAFSLIRVASKFKIPNNCKSFAGKFSKSQHNSCLGFAQSPLTSALHHTKIKIVCLSGARTITFSALMHIYFFFPQDWFLCASPFFFLKNMSFYSCFFLVFFPFLNSYTPIWSFKKNFILTWVVSTWIKCDT